MRPAAVSHHDDSGERSRHLQAIERRDRHPESWLWDTEEGRGWLIRLVVATLFIFGLKRGVGTETISEFFGRLRLEAHVGCSPSALRGVMQGLEHAMLATAATGEHDGVAHGEIRPIIGAVDATFLQRLMLVFVDLTSGSLLVEEVAVDRTYDTWHGVVKARLKTLGGGVLSLVSDRAKALIKLAETGRECLSIPEVFHLLHELVTSYSLAIFSRLRHAQQALHHAQERLARSQASPPDGAEVRQAQAVVAACEGEVKHWQDVRIASRSHLETFSLILHPWRVRDSTRQTSKDVECQWQAEVAALERWLETNGVPLKKQALNKVRTQLAGVSALVDFWWQGVWQDGQSQVVLPLAWRHWIEEGLLPRRSWQEHGSRTRCPQRKAKILQALEAVQAAFETHPITQRLASDVLAGWQAWAREHVRALQRASSAVAGRNGSLSQRQHTHQGLPKRRYQVWTVLHNFDCRASDGTTPASQFFRREFPDLFETVLSQIDDLPRPRRRHQAIAISD